jgi:CDP-glycerol glycerophosphotransferase (TagB/SpsB family)
MMWVWGLASLFRALEWVLPVRQNCWCFCTWPGKYPHTIDNPRAVFEEIKDDPDILKVILSRADLRKTPPIVVEGRNVLFVEAESARAAYLLSRSDVVVLGYSLAVMSSYSRFLTRKHKIIQLWHGIPLKRIGKLFPPENFWEKETGKYAATVSSSERDQATMAKAFDPLPIDRVWLTGLPRNALFLKAEKKLPEDYRMQLDDLRKRLRNRRMILYAPTWRETAEGMYPFSDEEKRELDGLLTRHNSAFAIRAHANRRDEGHDAHDVGSANILYVNDFPDVNLILRLTEVLVTDYSSIYIDFLLTNKPILHFTYDLDSYVNERGFLYDLKEAVASPCFTSFEQLLKRLERALETGGLDPEHHQRARKLFHSHQDDSAREVAQRIRLSSV